MRRAAARVVLALLVVGHGATVAAHEEHDVRVRAVLATPLPAELAGMRIEVLRTIAPQLVLANPTAHVVEVLDDDGTAFLRIGPGGVAGNVATPAWFQTWAPGVPVPAGARAPAAGPRWIRARAEPSFGWFDPRLEPAAGALRHSELDGGAPIDVGRWRIPLRVDGRPVTLSGSFRYEPPPAGAYAALLTSTGEIARGVQVRLLPGRTPGLLVKNTCRRPLTVLGDGGEPFLRIGPKNVEANVRSPAWSRSGRSFDTAAAGRGPSDAGAPHWLRVARTPSYSWIEPRVAGGVERAAAREPEGASAEPVTWEIPLLLGATPLRLTGTAVWRAARGDERNLRTTD